MLRFILLLLLFWVTPAWSVDNVVVMALFSNKAIVNIDGKRRTLVVGETSPEGVKLIAADSEEAVLEVAGKREAYPLGMHISVGYTPAEKTEVHLWADSSGMFKAQGSINGQSVEFLVDTGASTIAMNAQQAKRFGLNTSSGQVVQVATASGIETGHKINLNRVKVGEIELFGVDAIVMPGAFPAEILLGMSFLERLEMERSGKKMLLRLTH